jgi:predicted ATPase
LDALHYAAQRWAEAGAPILVLLALRQEALAELPELQRWLTRLKHDIAWVQVQLTKLSRAETEHLIRALLEPQAGNNEHDGAPPSGDETPVPSTRFSHWLFAETAGQPLYLVEILQTLVEDGLLRPAPASTVWHLDWSKFDEQLLRSPGATLLGVREIARGWLDYNLPL